MAFSSHNPYWRQVWHKKRTKLINAVSDGMVYLEVRGTKLFVACPYKDAFVGIAYAYSGRYLKRTMRWTFPIRNRELVVAECKRIYGDNHIVVKGKL